MKLKMLFMGIAAAFIFGSCNDAVNAQTAIGAGCEEALKTGTTVYYPPMLKTSAQEMYNAQLKQGFCAKLVFDSSRNEWALTVKSMLNNGSRRGTIKTEKTVVKAKTGTTKTTTKNTTTTTTTKTDAIPNGASITYFRDRRTAEGLYKGTVRSGNWAKIWNAGSKGWAVAVKVK